jgi:hypothetical protein
VTAGPTLRTRPPARRKRRPWRIVLGLLALGAAFAVGLALGESLRQSQGQPGEQTFVRTLQPLPLAPDRETVTVTVTTTSTGG